jgi:anti-anti-sigma factor
MISVRRSTESGGLIRLFVSGEADLATVDELSLGLAAAIGANGVRRIVVDLTELSFCDSCGLAALDEAFDAARQRGIDLRVTNPQGGVRRVLEITGLLDTLTQD